MKTIVANRDLITRVFVRLQEGEDRFEALQRLNVPFEAKLVHFVPARPYRSSRCPHS